MTTPFYNSDYGNIILKNNYPFGLNNNIIGNNISTIIPSIIPLFYYKRGHFSIKKKMLILREFYFPNLMILNILMIKLILF